MSENENLFDDMPVIYSYTRAQAMEDGVLIDLTNWAKETGFVVPVACTATVWHEHIVPPEGTRECGQCERGRGHDVLIMLYGQIRESRNDEQMFFDVLFLDAKQKVHAVRFKAICGPGDDGEPVLTILMPSED